MVSGNRWSIASFWFLATCPRVFEYRVLFIMVLIFATFSLRCLVRFLLVELLLCWMFCSGCRWDDFPRGMSVSCFDNTSLGPSSNFRLMRRYCGSSSLGLLGHSESSPFSSFTDFCRVTICISMLSNQSTLFLIFLFIAFSNG